MSTIDGLSGSYSKTNNGYQIKYSLGWNAQEGKYEVIYKNVKDLKEVFDVLASINSYINAGNSPSKLKKYLNGDTVVMDEQISFKEFAEDFYKKQTIKKEVSDRTLSDYSCHINKMLPYLGHISISNITPAILEQMFINLRSNDSRNTNNKSVSGTYAAHIYSTLKLILDRAVRYDLISKNPCERIDKPKRDTQEKICLNIQQARCLVSKASSGPLDPKMIGILICLLSGTRLSEMLALTWEDYHDKTLFINKSMKKDRKSVV